MTFENGNREQSACYSCVLRKAGSDRFDDELSVLEECRSIVGDGDMGLVEPSPPGKLFFSPRRTVYSSSSITRSESSTVMVWCVNAGTEDERL